MSSDAGRSSVGLVLAGTLGVSAAACPSLAGFSGGAGDASMQDRSLTDAGHVTDRGDGGDGASSGETSNDEAAPLGLGIRCMKDAAPSLDGSVYCDPTDQECCADQPGDEASLSCVTKSGCGGENQSEIQCDRPSQCGDAACRICLMQGYLSGTSCSLGEIMDADLCFPGNVDAGYISHVLCSPDGGDAYCAKMGGVEDKCEPLDPPPVGFVQDWFYACSRL